MRMNMLKYAALRNAAQSVLLLLLLPWTANAQEFSVRTGANINPDQFAFGSQYEVGPIVDRVWFQPNADIGFGDSATLVTVNMDLVYRHPLAQKTPWTLYAGGGSALNLYRMDGYSRTLAGVNVLGGVAHRNGLFTQVTVGFVDSPDFKLGVGYTFHPSKRPRRPVRR